MVIKKKISVYNEQYNILVYCHRKLERASYENWVGLIVVLSSDGRTWEFSSFVRTPVRVVHYSNKEEFLHQKNAGFAPDS